MVQFSCPSSESSYHYVFAIIALWVVLSLRASQLPILAWFRVFQRQMCRYRSCCISQYWCVLGVNFTNGFVQTCWLPISIWLKAKMCPARRCETRLVAIVETSYFITYDKCVQFAVVSFKIWLQSVCLFLCIVNIISRYKYSGLEVINIYLSLNLLLITPYSQWGLPQPITALTGREYTLERSPVHHMAHTTLSLTLTHRSICLNCGGIPMKNQHMGRACKFHIEKLWMQIKPRTFLAFCTTNIDTHYILLLWYSNVLCSAMRWCSNSC